MAALKRVNRIKGHVVLLLIVALFPGAASAQDPKDFGVMWRALAPSAQVLYIEGLQEGAQQVVLLAWTLSDSLRARNEREARQLRWLQLSPSQRNGIVAMAQDRYEAYSTERVGLDPV